MPPPVDALDSLFALAAGRPRFFADGWGDLALLEQLSVAACVAGAPERIEVRARGGDGVDAGARPAGVGDIRTATFASPETRLPPEARTARILRLDPPRPPRAALLLLAASGDQGFAMRRRFAATLVASGVVTVLLENPYYGSRRPRRQSGAAVRTVADMALMATATVREARALLAWLAARTGLPVGVAGYSMGGQMAALTGASMPFPVACVPLAPSSTPASVFTEGLLKRAVDADALGRTMAPGSVAMSELRELFLKFDVCTLPAPLCPAAAIVVAAERDGIVPPAEPARIARHWGAELRWLPTGHVGAVLRHGRDMRAAITPACERLGVTR
jgi:dienelactone hydrolase